jgi:hypothetical protein
LRDYREMDFAARTPNDVHRAHPWLIAEIAPDFELLDAWELPAEGAKEDFAELVAMLAEIDPAAGDSSRATRALFRLRHRLGELFGWDEPDRQLAIPGCAEASLIARVPKELRETATQPRRVSSATVVPLYATDREWAAEISNATVHGVLQLTWIERRAGVYRGRLAVYVKPRGRRGAAYLKLIGPFRHLIVYPALIGQIGRAWAARAPGARST